MSPVVGEPAPDFTLLDQDRQPVTLSALRGSPVLLVFYPFAFSRLCTSELRRLRDELAHYTGAGVRVLALSTDPVYSLKVFREQEGLDFPLLSDFWPHGSAARAYGAFNEQAGMALRATFLLDAAGVVRFAQVNGPGDVREQSEWRDAVAGLAR
jgi:peroxiredoxin